MGKIFSPELHLARWQATLTELSIKSSLGNDEVHSVMDQLLRRNVECVESHGDVGITLFATPGTGTSSSDTTLGIHLNRLNFGLIQQRRASGQPLVVVDTQQPPPESWSRSAKTRCRLHYYLADQIARDSNSDAIAVLRDQDGTVTETSIANLAIVVGGEVLSPPGSRILSGVTQQVIQKLAQTLKLEWREEPISSSALTGADEVILMGTDAGLWFAKSVDGRSINDGCPGAVYQRLLVAFDQLMA